MTRGTLDAERWLGEAGLLRLQKHLTRQELLIVDEL